MPKVVAVTRLEPELLDAVHKLADDRGWTVSQFIARAVERVVKGELAKRGTLGTDGQTTSP